jgi:hypothetical protein
MRCFESQTPPASSNAAYKKILREMPLRNAGHPGCSVLARTLSGSVVAHLKGMQSPSDILMRLTSEEKFFAGLPFGLELIAGFAHERTVVRWQIRVFKELKGASLRTRIWPKFIFAEVHFCRSSFLKTFCYFSL